MQLTDLPEEVLACIFKKLDLKSVYNLYEMGPFFKNIICMYRVVKTADMAVSTVATVRFFKQCFMKDISRHLHNLDLRGIGDLSKTSLVVAVGKMKCLKTLDVSYTKITLCDLFKVYEVCPTIKNIGCNFVFAKHDHVKANITDYQDLFQNFDKVHFVGNTGNLFYSNLAVWVLHKAHLSQLQLTIVENCSTLVVYNPFDNLECIDVPVNFKFINICILNSWKIPNSHIGTVYSLPNLLQNKEKYECVAIIEDSSNKSQLYVSPIFENSCECYNAKGIGDINPYRYIINGVIMLWDKEENVFDDLFFQKLKRKLAKFFPYHIKDDRTVAPEEVDNFFFSVPTNYTVSHDCPSSLNFKRIRLGPPPFNLDYDSVFSNHRQIHLTLFFPSYNALPVTVSPNIQYLRMLRSLHLTGFVHCSPEFFNVLFPCCEQLETLNVDPSRHLGSVVRYVPLCRRLKNLRLVEQKINFQKLFSSLSQCSTLENIHIVDLSKDYNALGNPRKIVENCANLYCISIFASMSADAKAKKTQLFKNIIKRLGKWHLRLELCTEFCNTTYSHDPYIDVFNINPIRPIEHLY